MLVQNSEGKRRHRLRWEDNIKMGLKEVGRDDVDWLHVFQVRDHWLALMNTVLNLRIL
jgi:hypothetical protein